MYLIDLDTVDWSKAPEEFAGYASIQGLSAWLRTQPSITALVVTDSQHPLIKAKGLEIAMDWNRLMMDMAQMIGYQNALKHIGGKT